MKQRKSPKKKQNQWLAKAWSVLWPIMLSYGAKLVFDLTLATLLAPAVVEQLPRVVLV